MKAPDGSRALGRVYTRQRTDIGRASRYEYVGRQPGIRIQAAIAGVRSTEQSAFMHGDACVSRHVRLL